MRIEEKKDEYNQKQHPASVRVYAAQAAAAALLRMSDIASILKYGLALILGDKVNQCGFGLYPSTAILRVAAGS